MADTSKPTNITRFKQVKKQLLQRTWRDWIAHALLVGMHNGAATLEQSGSFPNIVPTGPSVPLLAGIQGQ